MTLEQPAQVIPEMSRFGVQLQAASPRFSRLSFFFFTISSIRSIALYNSLSTTVKTRIIGPCAMYDSPKFPPLEKGGVEAPKNMPPRQVKKNTDLTRRGKSNVLEHSPIIRVFTVYKCKDPEIKSA